MEPKQIRVIINNSLDGTEAEFQVKDTVTGGKLFDKLLSEFSLDRAKNPHLKLVYKGKEVRPDQTLAEVGVGDGDSLKLLNIGTAA